VSLGDAAVDFYRLPNIFRSIGTRRGPQRPLPWWRPIFTARHLMTRRGMCQSCYTTLNGSVLQTKLLLDLRTKVGMFRPRSAEILGVCT